MTGGILPEKKSSFQPLGIFNHVTRCKSPSGFFSFFFCGLLKSDVDKVSPICFSMLLLLRMAVFYVPGEAN